MPVTEHAWRAMGGGAQIVVVGRTPEPLVRRAVQRIAQLEERWSRFIPTSDISRLARGNGLPVQVSDDTVLALTRAVEGWEATAGRFDPTVGAALGELGYDRSFDDIVAAGPPPEIANAPGCSALQIDVASGYVTAPVGVQLDLGGIGKGLAADLVVAELRAAGADGVCVNLGGDLRVSGRAPEAEAWVVCVERPGDSSEEIARVAVSEGAIATSDARGKTWRRGSAVMRHVVDPSTGRPVEPVGAVTVVAGECWWAEVLATAATVAGPDEMNTLVPALGGEFLLVDPSGDIRRSPGFAAFAI